MYECETCSDSFWYQKDCENHMSDYDHWPECETCDRTFCTQRACDHHMDDKDHWAPLFQCETCTKEFHSQSAANQHMTAVRHWIPRIPCQTCAKRFHTETAVNQHMRDRGHYKHFCNGCRLPFQDSNSLKMHLKSRIHRGAAVACPFCKLSYTAASGLCHHIETGSCFGARDLDREIISRMIDERDPHGIITNKQIGWHKEEKMKYSATGRAFNGSYWECYMCHKEFNTSSALSAHLNSPAHKQKVYHCPNTSSPCLRQFVNLAGLFNHLESESCAFMKFDKVQSQVGNVIQGRKMIILS